MPLIPWDELNRLTRWVCDSNRIIKSIIGSKSNHSPSPRAPVPSECRGRVADPLFH
jgi:hypothetical protein